MDKNIAETTEPIEETIATPDETAAPVTSESVSTVVPDAATEAPSAAGTMPVFAAQEEMVPVKKEGFFSKKNLKRIIALVAVLALVIGGAVGYILYNSPKAVAERFVLALFSGGEVNAGRFFAYDYYESLLKSNDMTAEEYFEEKGEDYDEDISSWNDYIKVMRKHLDERWIDLLGKYKITAEATKETDMSMKKLKSEVGDRWIERLESRGLLDFDTFTAGKKVIVKAKIAGEDDIERRTCEIYLVKAGGWKVLDWNYE